MTPYEACNTAYRMRKRYNFDLISYQEIACLEATCASYFAYTIPGADIEYCQKHACKDPKEAYWFAQYIIGADIEYCQKHACKNSAWAYKFARDIPGADLQYCRKACQNSEYYLNKINELIIRKILV